MEAVAGQLRLGLMTQRPEVQEAAVLMAQQDHCKLAAVAPMVKVTGVETQFVTRLLGRAVVVRVRLLRM